MTSRYSKNGIWTVQEYKNKKYKFQRRTNTNKDYELSKATILTLNNSSGFFFKTNYKTCKKINI